MEYIISRPKVSEHSKEFAADLYFNLWKKKNRPYSELQRGDFLYWYETQSRCIVWKSQVIEVERFFYQDKSHLRETLKSRFGSFKEDHSYLIHAPASGHCLAYKIQPLERLNIPKPDKLQFPHLGWLKSNDRLAEKWFSALESRDERSSTEIPPVRKDGDNTFRSKAREIHYWWVNQNRTYNSEVPGGFLWSPKTRADGARNQFYENMRRVEPGDEILSFHDARIKAIGLATGKVEPAPIPDFGNAGGSWSNEGWLVPVEFRELSNPFRPKDHIEQLRSHLPAKYSPLQKSGDGLQSVYLAEIPKPMADKLIELIGPIYDSHVKDLRSGIDDSTDLEDAEEAAIKGRTDIGPTTKTQLNKARRGQSIFRANVRLNEKRCRVTGITDIKHLRASHIKPWIDSSDEEKLNGCNGLLLAPHVDHLFDKGFISFKNSGEMLASDQLDPSVLRAWNISVEMNVGGFNEEQIKFLEYHREHKFKKNK